MEVEEEDVKMKKNFYLQKLLMRKKCRIFMVNYSRKRSSSNIEQWPMKVPQRIQLSYQHFHIWASEKLFLFSFLPACLLTLSYLQYQSDPLLSHFFLAFISANQILLCVYFAWMTGWMGFSSHQSSRIFFCVECNSESAKKGFSTYVTASIVLVIVWELLDLLNRQKIFSRPPPPLHRMTNK